MNCHKCKREINPAVEDTSLDLPFLDGEIDWLAGDQHRKPVCDRCWDEVTMPVLQDNICNLEDFESLQI